jgi:hypothetical protein
MEVRDATKAIIFLEEFFGINLKEKSRVHKFIFARSIFSKIFYEDYGFSYKDISGFLNIERTTVINSHCNFNTYFNKSRAVRTAYHELSVNLKLEKAKKESTDVDIAIDMISQLDGKELKEFLPRIDLYLKSVKYNRKKKQQWERPAASV